MAYFDPNTGLATDVAPAWVTGLPAFSLPRAAPGNWLTSGLATGFHEALGNVGAAAQTIPVPAIADWGKGFAQSQAARAAASGRPDLEANPWSPTGILYGLAKGIPATVGAIGTGALATAGAASLGTGIPEAVAAGLGAGAFMFPQAVGGNVQTAEAVNKGQLTPEDSAKSLLLGLPEAAMMSVMPGRLETILRNGAAGTLGKRLLTGAGAMAAYQAPLSGLQTAITQQAFTPDMSPVDRAKQIVSSTLSGGLQGAVFGGLTSAIRRAPPERVPSPDLAADVDDALDRKPLLALPAPTAPTMFGNAQGQVGESPYAVDIQNRANASVSGLPENPMPTALPPPSPLSDMPDAQLQRQVAELAAKGADRSENESRLQGLYQEEIVRRTPPGATPGLGFTMFTPEEMAAREQPVRIMRQQALEALSDSGTRAVNAALGSSFFRNFNSVDEPDLINALKVQKTAFDEAGGRVPKWFQTLAGQFGVLKGTEDVDPRAEAERIGAARDAARIAAEQAVTDTKRRLETSKFKTLSQQYNDATQLADWHDQAQARLDALKPPDVDAEQRIPQVDNQLDAGAQKEGVTNPPAELSKGPSPPKEAATLEEKADAVREPGAAGVDVRQAPEDGGAVGEGHTEGDVVAAETAPGQVGETVAEAGPADLKEVGRQGLVEQLGSNIPREPLAPIEPKIPVDASIHVARTDESATGMVHALLADPTALSPAERVQAQKALDATSEIKGLRNPHAPLQFLQALNKVAAAARPDGPFTGHTEPVVGTPNVPPEQTRYVADVMHALGMSKIRVALVHPDDVGARAGRANGMSGDYAKANKTGKVIQDDPNHPGHVRTFGPDNKDFMMYIKPGMSPAETASTIVEEVGHIVQKVAVRNAPEGTQAKLVAAHEAFVKATTGLKAQDLIRASRNRAQSEAALKELDPQQLASEHPNADYYRSFSEWFANNVGRYLTASKKAGPRDALGKFFSGVAEKLRTLLSYVTGKEYLPDATVKAFVDRMGPAHEVMWQGEGETDPQFSLSPTSPPPATPREADGRLHDYLANVETLKQRVVPAVLSGRISVGGGVRRAVLGGLSRQGLVDIFGSKLKTAGMHRDAQVQRESIERVKNKTFGAAMRPFTQVSEKVQGAISAFMRDSAETGLDGRKTFAEQPEFHDDPRAAILRTRSDQLNKDLARIRQLGGGPALDSLRTGMKLARLQETAASLQHWVEAFHPELKDTSEAFKANADETFQYMTTAHDDPALATKFYEDVTNAQVAALTKHIGEVDAAAAPLQAVSPKKYTAMRETVDDLRGQLELAQKSLRQAQGVYFPLVRNGDFFVSGRFAVDEQKRVNAGAVSALRDALHAAGFDEIGVFSDPASSAIMARVGSEGQMSRLAGIFRDLQAKGHLDSGEAIKLGYPDQLNTLAGLGPKYLQQMAERVRGAVPDFAEGTSDQEKAAVIKARGILAHGMMLQYLDTLPFNTLAKFNQERRGVSGFDPNMVKSLGIRSQTSARSSTNLGMSGKFARINEAMRQEVQNAKSNPQLTPSGAVTVQDVAREIQLREAQKLYRVPSKFIDAAQSITSSIAIGSNPAYILTMMSQIPMLLHGELAKQFGYAPSAVAIGKVGARTWNVMRAVFKSPDWAEVMFREDALRAAGIPERDIGIIMRADNRGDLSNNTFVNSLTDMGVGADPTSVKFKNYANMLGINAEMSVRVSAALSAADLYDKRAVPGLTRDQYVSQIVNGSQFEWGAGASSRATSRYGTFGPYTRISLAFMNFQTHMLEKLYKESHALMGKDGPQAQKEAGMFLATHLIATVAIAGTLGLPGAGIVAGVTDRLAKLFTGRDDIDVQGLYRTWLSNTFGADVADVMAKGLPRALGIDVSHLGDQDLVPTTHYWQEKRKFEDAEKDWLKSMAGSAFGDVANVFLGGRDMLNGDYMLGATKMLPELLKSPAEAYYVASHGYVDKNGIALPMTPGALDILKLAVGVDPANYAQYQEANRIKTGLLAQREVREQNISRHLSMGLMNPSSANMGYWMQQAVDYTRQHPALGGPLSDMGTNFQEHMMQGAFARALHQPIGVKPFDLGLQSATGFLNP